MAEQIRFFKKNIIDLDNDNVTITITDAVATNTGQDFVDFIRNRKNTSGWLTTDSTDAANTQIDIDYVDARDIDRILVVGHNWKAFTIQYWNGATFTDFSTAISETTNAEFVSNFGFDSVNTDQIRIIITGAQTVDADKQLLQLILTEDLGQLEALAEITNPKVSENKRRIKMLSGKTHLAKSVGAFSCDLRVRNWNIEEDLDLIEDVYFKLEGVLVWLNGDDDTQFSRLHRGYRKQDIFLMSPVNEWEPEFYKSLYQTGIKLNIKLEEVVR